MAALTSEVVRDETFERRHASMEALVAELRERTALVAAGGGEKATSSATALAASSPRASESTASSIPGRRSSS